MTTYSFETNIFYKDLKSNLETDMTGKYGTLNMAWSKHITKDSTYPRIIIEDQGISTYQDFLGDAHYNGSGELLYITFLCHLITNETTGKENDNSETLYQGSLISYLRHKIFDSFNTQTFSNVTVVGKPSQFWDDIFYDEDLIIWRVQGSITYKLLNTR